MHVGKKNLEEWEENKKPLIISETQVAIRRGDKKIHNESDIICCA